MSIPSKLEIMLEHIALDRSYRWTERGQRKDDGKAYYLMLTLAKGPEIDYAKNYYKQAIRRYDVKYNPRSCLL